MDDMSGLAGAGIFLVLVWLFALVACVAVIAGQWKIFQKAGRPGWATIVPYYCNYVLFDIAWGNGWMFLCTLIPIVGIFFPIIATYKLAQSFGKGLGYTLGLLFLPIIFYPMLGFGDATYGGPA